MDSPSSSKINEKRCKYTLKRCYLKAGQASDYCLNHDPASEELGKCEFICPYSQVKCDNTVINEAEKKIKYCLSHNLERDNAKQRYKAFEQAYITRVPTHKRRIDIDFQRPHLDFFYKRPRFVDVLSRDELTHPLAHAGVFTDYDLKNLSIDARKNIIHQLENTRNLLVHRTHALADLLNQQIAAHSIRNEERDTKFYVCTPEAIETAHKFKIMRKEIKKDLDALALKPKKEEETKEIKNSNKSKNPSKSYQTIDFDDQGYEENGCHFAEVLERAVDSAAILESYDETEEIEEAVTNIMDFMIDALSKNTNIIAYKPKRICNNLKLPHFQNCFKHLWKEIPTVKRCSKCSNTCTLCSNLCGNCLKPYIQIKALNIVTLSENEKDNTRSVTIGDTDGDFEAIVIECAGHLQKDDNENELQKKEIILQLSEIEQKNLIDYELLKQIWNGILPSNSEYDSRTLTQNVKAKRFNLPVSIPIQNLPPSYTKEKIIEKSNLFIHLPIRNESEIVFPTEDELVQDPLCCYFPEGTLSESHVSRLDRPVMVVGVPDNIKLPIQFRPSVAPSLASTKVVNFINRPPQINRPPVVRSIQYHHHPGPQFHFPRPTTIRHGVRPSIIKSLPSPGVGAVKRPITVVRQPQQIVSSQHQQQRIYQIVRPSPVYVQPVGYNNGATTQYVYEEVMATPSYDQNTGAISYFIPCPVQQINENNYAEEVVAGVEEEGKVEEAAPEDPAPPHL